ncbi:MAG: WG repeat-containing protein [Planctomycetota bacterium]|nr:WG repeat-containing protein [Planctomycetota bacterium]
MVIPLTKKTSERLLLALLLVFACISFTSAENEPGKKRLLAVAARQAYAFISESGKLRYGRMFAGARPFSDGLAAVRSPAGWGYMDEQGELVIDFRFGDARDFENGVARVALDEKWGLIDREGEFILPPTFKNISRFSEGLASFQSFGGKWGYLSTDGRIRISANYDLALDFSEGHAAVMRFQLGEPRWGFIDTTGSVVMPLDHARARSFVNGRAAVTSLGSFAYFGKDGKFTTPFVFEQALDYSQEMAPAKLNGKWCFLNRRGEVAIDPAYAAAGPFRENRAPVALYSSGRYSWGYVDKQGNQQVSTVLQACKPFHNGLARCQVRWCMGARRTKQFRQGEVLLRRPAPRSRPLRGAVRRQVGCDGTIRPDCTLSRLPFGAALRGTRAPRTVPWLRTP